MCLFLLLLLQAFILKILKADSVILKCGWSLKNVECTALQEWYIWVKCTFKDIENIWPEFALFIAEIWFKTIKYISLNEIRVS